MAQVNCTLTQRHDERKHGHKHMKTAMNFGKLWNLKKILNSCGFYFVISFGVLKYFCVSAKRTPLCVTNSCRTVNVFSLCIYRFFFFFFIFIISFRLPLDVFLVSTKSKEEKLLFCAYLWLNETENMLLQVRTTAVCCHDNRQRLGPFIHVRLSLKCDMNRSILQSRYPVKGTKLAYEMQAQTRTCICCLYK